MLHVCFICNCHICTFISVCRRLLLQEEGESERSCSVSSSPSLCIHGALNVINSSVNLIQRESWKSQRVRVRGVKVASLLMLHLLFSLLSCLASNFAFLPLIQRVYWFRPFYFFYSPLNSHWLRQMLHSIYSLFLSHRVCHTLTRSRHCSLSLSLGSHLQVSHILMHIHTHSHVMHDNL